MSFFSLVEYKLTCQFIGGDIQSFSLQEGLKYESIEGFKGLYQIANKDDIEKGIIYLGEAVKRLLKKVDVSDPMSQLKKLEYIRNRVFNEI